MIKIERFPETLNTQQLMLLSDKIASLSECPLSLERMKDPCTSPCGHTFDYSYILQSLEYKETCPLDRNYLTGKELVVNHFAKTLLENRCMAVFNMSGEVS